jgi:hypothetical protein
MTLTRLTKRFTAWIACFAILMTALSPSISQALVTVTNSDAVWTEICSSSGLKQVNTDKERGSSQDKKAIHSEHCPFCSTHANMVGLPPSSSFNLPALSRSFLHPALFYQSPRPLFVWASAQSRAPPAFS